MKRLCPRRADTAPRRSPRPAPRTRTGSNRHVPPARRAPFLPPPDCPSLVRLCAGETALEGIRERAEVLVRSAIYHRRAGELPAHCGLQLRLGDERSAPIAGGRKAEQNRTMLHGVE